MLERTSPCDQRTATLAEFLAHLALPGAAGRALAAARLQADERAAVRLVARHFRARPGPRWAFYMHGTAWLEIDGRGGVLEKAEDLLRHRFRNSWPPFETQDLATDGAEPDWERGIQTKATSLARQTFVSELTTAFALTGKRAYLMRARELIQSFAAHYPFVLEDGFFEDHDRHFGGKCNETLTVTYRVLRWLDLLHSGALQVPGVFSDEDVCWLVRQFWFYAMQFHRFCGDAMRRDNHHLVDHGHAPYVLGIMFPEFSVARALYDQGRRTIAHHFTHNVFADGGNAEHSTKYQYHILYHYLNPQALARANGRRLFSAAQLRRLARWVEFNAHACKPDGVLADFGDEFGGSLDFLFGSLAVPVLDARLQALARALGCEPGRLRYETPAALARRFARWTPGAPPRVGLAPRYAPGRRVGRPQAAALPRPASVRYPQGGYTFFRADWQPGADYLAVSHYTESLPHGHAHWDMLSFVLHTQGRTLLGDPATWLYTDPRIWSGARAQEFRGYSYSVDAHNCLVMNDDTLKPLKALGHGCFWGGWPPKHGLGLFKAGGPIEVGEAWHDAYAPTRQRRFIVHLRGLGFAFVDLLSRTQPDLRPHQYAQLLHFEGGVELAPEAPAAGQALRASAGAAQCLVIPGTEAATAWKTWRDERLQDLYGVSAGRREPWVAELTRRIQGPAVFTTFLITRPARDLAAPPAARYLGARPAQWLFRQHDGYSAHALDLGAHGTVLLASCPYGQALAHPELATDAELAAVLLDAHARPRAWVLVRGTHLSSGKRSLYRGRKVEYVSGS